MLLEVCLRNILGTSLVSTMFTSGFKVESVLGQLPSCYAYVENSSLRSRAWRDFQFQASHCSIVVALIWLLGWLAGSLT
uniref:Uncharacterized protein n=1 Tax=Physcomitrium patens TaxID=3218 RepID=A0A7I3YV48_PHYPA